MTEKKVIDWERIERDYRAGLLSVREIAAARGITHGAINKRAKRDGWDRDLHARIQAKADALVSKREVSTTVSAEQADTDRLIVEANATVVADVRMAHRKDISRSRKLANSLLGELEAMTDNAESFANLGEILGGADDSQDKLIELYRKVIALPGRSRVLKELSDTLKTLIALERQAYSIDELPAGDNYDDMLLALIEKGHS